MHPDVLASCTSGTTASLNQRVPGCEPVGVLLLGNHPTPASAVAAAASPDHGLVLLDRSPSRVSQALIWLDLPMWAGSEGHLQRFDCVSTEPGRGRLAECGCFATM